VLGYAALSLLCWQSVDDDRRRILSLAGLSASLAAALASHYYAVLIFVPLAAGEVARTIVRRRLDPWVWLAFALATIPLLVFLPLIQSGRKLPLRSGQSLDGSTCSFIRTPPRQHRRHLFFRGDPVLLTLYAAVRSSIGAEPKVRPASRIPPEEVVAALGYLAIPVLAVLLGKLATGAFTDRYAMAAVLGLAVIIPWGAYFILDGRATMGIALAAALFCWFVVEDGIEPALKQRRELAGSRTRSTS
jgi:hypothetical protein